MIKLNAKQLRKENLKLKIQKSKLRKNHIYILLDNVLDTYNIGSIFRLAEAVAAKKIYLCGGSAVPPNPRIKKASINTTEIVDWTYYASALEAISNLKSQISNLQVVAIEQSAKSTPYNKFDYSLPIALVIGHETEGVSTEVLEMADGVVEIPMFGINISLNVVVATGIVLYKVLEKRL